jgi:hypothetical protein
MPILSTVGGSRLLGKALPVVTGGTLISSDATYYYRVFTTSGNLVVSKASLNCEYLIIGGGGPGSFGCGGGGAGGVRSASATLAPATYGATIGEGGGQFGIGGSSQFNSLVSAGGGTNNLGSNTDLNGGSGAGGNAPDGYNRTGGTGISGQGFAGGASTGMSTARGGGGGGGSGAVGGATSGATGGNGGIGTNAYSTWVSAILSSMSASFQSGATNGRIAAGGGGGAYTSNTQGSGGEGGGGIGGNATFTVSNTGELMNGKPNTGSGGGGGGLDNSQPGGGYTVYAPGNGGTGLVVVRYLKSAV